MGHYEHMQPDDFATLSTLLSTAFGFPAADTPAWLEQVTDDVRVYRQEDAVLGSLLILPMGQYFGGRRVSMGGLAAVAVAPEARGQGVSTRMLKVCLEELRQRGFALSALYPSTWPVYRKVGYELAGTQFQARVRTASIPSAGRHNVRPLLAADRPDVEELYSQIAPVWSGWLDRSEYMWRRVFEPFNQTPSGYVVGERGDPEGYVMGYLKHDGSDYNLVLTDLQARTCTALDHLLSLLAGYRSTVQHVEWHCSALDATLLRFPDKAARLHAQRHWMLRIVDVERALRERGYAVGVDAELHMDIRDDVLNGNQGRFVLRVRHTKAEVEAGGRGDLKLSIRTLAPLYSGFMSPWALRQAGLIEAEAPVLSAAASLFSTGGQPCMLDMF